MPDPSPVALGDRAATRFRSLRLEFFEFRARASVLTQVSLALGFAGLTGLAAQIRIPLPFTPVPITLQTFAVLLAGVVLGLRTGALSQALYVGIGLAGVPWFQGAGAGLGHLLGPTGGYLVGFVAAAAVVGWLTGRSSRFRRLPALLVVLGFGNLLIYAVGLPWLYGWVAAVQGSPPGLLELLTLGLFPFVLGDLVKLGGAAAVARVITPREAVGATAAG